MEERMIIKCAGDINAELCAIEELTEMSSVTDAKASHTSECGMFLTIYCC